MEAVAGWWENCDENVFVIFFQNFYLTVEKNLNLVLENYTRFLNHAGFEFDFAVKT